MGSLTQLALDASIWPLPPPLECVWKILDQRSQRCPISPYPRSRRRSGSKKTSKSGCFLSHFRFFCSWDLPEPPAGEYCIPKCLAQNFRKVETPTNHVRCPWEPQNRKNRWKIHSDSTLLVNNHHPSPFWWTWRCSSNFYHKKGYFQNGERHIW